MKIESFRDNRGITLVALVITIIVLLILAGVSLNLAVGGDGIVNKAIDASTAYTEAEIKETIDSAYQQAIIGQLFSDDEDKISESIENDLKKHYENVSVTPKNGTYEVNLGDKGVYTVSDSGTSKNEAGGPGTPVTINFGSVKATFVDGLVGDGVGIVIEGLPVGLTPISVVNNDQQNQSASTIPGYDNYYWDVTDFVKGWGTTIYLKLTVRDESENEGSTVLDVTPTCFVAGTKVLTPNGLKNIENIEIGDKVISMNMENMIQEEKEVTNTFIHETTEQIYNIYAGDKVISATCAHLMYTKNKGWLPVCKLNVGDILNDAENNDVVITDIIIEKNEDKKLVYNFEVKDNHTYFVGENNILVHNAKAPL